MLEFRARCRPENATDVTCAISDCSVSATFAHSLNFFCGFYSLLKKLSRENVEFLLSKLMVLFPLQSTAQSILIKIRKFKSSTKKLGSSK